MSFTDPISFDPDGGGAVNFNRILSDGRSARYRAEGIGAGDPVHEIFISHTVGSKRTRSVFRVDHSVLSADLITPDLNSWESGSFYLVSDIPTSYASVGPAEQAAKFTGLNTLLSASSNAKLLAWLNGQS
jgi:hypothetical protein